MSEFEVGDRVVVVGPRHAFTGSAVGQGFDLPYHYGDNDNTPIDYGTEGVVVEAEPDYDGEIQILWDDREDWAYWPERSLEAVRLDLPDSLEPADLEAWLAS